MREARHKALLRKAISACVAAIEVYNKPVMPHRDETFAMLAVNAWELLLKARLVKEAKNQLRAIQVLVPVEGKDGKPTKRLRVDTNRAGNAKTISLGEAVHRVKQLPKQKLDAACEANLWSLVEIRDNAVHFIIEDAEMMRRAHEASTACIHNFVVAVGEWFDHSLSEHRFMIMPLSFDAATGPALAVPGRRTQQAANLMAFLDRASDDYPVRASSAYAAAVKLETRIVGGRNKDAAAVRLTGGPDAPEFRLSEEKIRDNWPMDYGTLQKRAKARLPDIKFNRAFNEAMRRVKSNLRFVHRRHLDPDNLKSPKKEFFSEAALDALIKAMEPLTLG
ncbi:DUF3644 domain-containing protein [Dankookia rubra]|uniref:DUF3644 domain-containing protein n=1 Tax=Dankookia rubra TaxID=1442381 RepID=A0A4R5Q7G3_9PROT|nr:DUF3644 domain-containing protein [Dankookia rubra]TDH58017.1 DUF3644 domain-containing protein [Dankookia rubra]